MSDNQQLIEAPRSTNHIKIEQLAYLDSYDVVIDRDYALVLYSETKVAGGKSVLKIKSKNTAGSTFDEDNDSFKNALRAAGARGVPYIFWGFRFNTKDTDPRVIENRVFMDELGKPTALEIHLVTRKADGSANEPKMVRVDWPF